MERKLLTSEERDLLRDHKDQAPFILMRRKAEALLLLDRDVDPAIVADFVGRQPSTVATWLRDWRTERMGSIYTGHASNLNRSKLTAAQREQTAAVLAEAPSDHGLPGQFWSVPALEQWVSSQFGVVYESDSSYHFLMRHAGLSFHQPEALDKRRADDAAIDARIAEIRTEIADALDDQDTLVFAADEVRIDQEAITRKAWCTKGATTIIAVDRTRQAQSYIGFLDQNSGAVELERLDWQNGETILAAVQTLTARHPDRKIVIVWDNASWHKSKLIRAELTEGQTLENVHLVAFPPYAPDHNPIEHVWGEAKNDISNIQRDEFGQTMLAFENSITSRTFPYRI